MSEQEHGADRHARQLPCPMCDQCGHMIRAAKNRDETDLAQTLTAVLDQHRNQHHPATTPNTRFRSVS